MMQEFTSLRLARIEHAKSSGNWLLMQGHNKFVVTPDEKTVQEMRGHLPGHVDKIRAHGRDEVNVPF